MAMGILGENMRVKLEVEVEVTGSYIIRIKQYILSQNSRNYLNFDKNF